MSMKLIQGDCLEVMKALPDNSVDAVVTDPPYNIGKAEWDKIPDYVEWCGKWILESQRILKDTGSFYFFHNDMEQVADLMLWIRKNTTFIFKQFIVWNKRFNGSKRKGYFDGYVCVENLRNYKKMAEYCLFYTFQDETGLTKIYGTDSCFSSIRGYLKDEKAKAGLKTCKQINQLLQVDDNGGGMASHYFSNKTDFKQWALPTKEMYSKLQSTGYFQRPYEDLRREYEDLRYTFNNQKTHHSVWNYEIAQRNEHVTPKPVDLIENILLHSSNEGDTILDPFMGSGTTGVSCVQTGRHFIGIDKDIRIATRRIEDTDPLFQAGGIMTVENMEKGRGKR